MLGVPRPQVSRAFLIRRALFIVWYKVMNGDVVTILQQQLSECKSAKTFSVHYDDNYHEIMQEMFKFERSKVKFAQILVRPWPDLKPVPTPLNPCIIMSVHIKL